MKALFFDGNMSLRDVPRPEPPSGEALIKVIMAGICRTDLEISRGYMDFRGIPGHEFVGVVERSPDPSLEGKRVVGEINAGCGECSLCRKGLERHCARRTVLGILGRDGALAEYLTLPVSNLLVVPDGVSDRDAAFTEPLAAAVEVLEQTPIRPADRVLVIGDGKLGLLVSMVLRLTGCDLLMVGKHPEKMGLFDPTGKSFRLLDEFSAVEERFDVVVEASGHPSGWGSAVSRVKPRGILVLKSTYQGALDFNPAPIVVDEITVVGSRCGLFAPALRMMDLGLVDPSPLVSGIFSLDDAEEAFQRSGERGVLKILVKM